MKVSVILPTYNRADTLATALASVLAQTRPADEIIVVDDASTDGTAELVSRFAQVRYLPLASNRGAAHARNLGVAEASGDWVAFLDSDDVWLPQKLQQQCEAVQARHGVDLLCAGMLVQRQHGAYELHLPTALHGQEDLSISALHAYPFAPSSWLMRRALFQQLGGFDESMASCEDWDFLVRLAAHGRIAALPDPLLVKYNRADSLDAEPARKLASYRQMLARYAEAWQADRSGWGRYLEKAGHAALRAGQPAQARCLLGLAARKQPRRLGLWVKWLLSAALQWPASAWLADWLWPAMAKARRRPSANSG